MSEKWTPGPWEYNDPEKFTQGHGRFSETAVYARGNAFPWRMAEIQGPDHATEVATAHLITAAPDLYEALDDLLAVFCITMPYADEDEDPDCPSVAIKARTALLRARGEQP